MRFIAKMLKNKITQYEKAFVSNAQRQSNLLKIFYQLYLFEFLSSNQNFIDLSQQLTAIKTQQTKACSIPFHFCV